MVGEIIYRVDNTIRKSTLHTNQDFEIELTYDSNQMKLKLIPKGTIELVKVIMIYPKELNYDLAFINGFQTWTESGVFSSSDITRRQSRILDNITRPISDYCFFPYKNIQGVCHSYTYIMLQRGQSNLLFISDKDDVCYSIYEMDFNKGQLSISLDVEGMVVTSETELMSIAIDSGDFCSIKERHFVDTSQKVSGWTSWYNYYTNITEDILLANLEHIEMKKLPFDIFQIDDGYQTKVGDWLSVKDCFPNGMAFISDKIQSKGLIPGLWVAPFIVLDSSEVFKQHPDWLMTVDGECVKAGWSPVWKGHYYTLDIYKTEVIEYLRDVFDTIINKWGFKFLKLDFLYAMATPYNGKSRSAVMTDGVELIQMLTQGAEILGCGAPLINVKNRFKYARIGADVYEKWENSLLRFLKYRERVSTYNALKSTIGRSFLNGCWFSNDPDVFYLRDKDVKMSSTQKETLFKVNVILGSLLFTSDDVSMYSRKMEELIRSMYPLCKTEIVSLDMCENLYTVELVSNDRRYVMYINLSRKSRQVSIANDLYMEGSLHEANNVLQIEPYETIIGHIYRLLKPLELIGCEGHILPLGNLKSFGLEDGVMSFEHGNPVRTLLIASQDKLNYDCVGNYKSYYFYRVRGTYE